MIEKLETIDDVLPYMIDADDKEVWIHKESVKRAALKFIIAKLKTKKSFRATDGEDFMEFFNFTKGDLNAE